MTLNPRTLVAAIAAAAVVLIIVAAILLSRDNSIDLRDDPRGQEACDALVASIRYSGDSEIGLGSLLGAGQAASKSRTKEIREATNEPVEGLEDFPIVDVDKLTAACEKAGVEIPERSAPIVDD